MWNSLSTKQPMLLCGLCVCSCASPLCYQWVFSRNTLCCLTVCCIVNGTFYHVVCKLAFHHKRFVCWVFYDGWHTDSGLEKYRLTFLFYWYNSVLLSTYISVLHHADNSDLHMPNAYTSHPFLLSCLCSQLFICSFLQCINLCLRFSFQMKGKDTRCPKRSTLINVTGTVVDVTERPPVSGCSRTVSSKDKKGYTVVYWG